MKINDYKLMATAASLVWAFSTTVLADNAQLVNPPREPSKTKAEKKVKVAATPKILHTTGKIVAFDGKEKYISTKWLLFNRAFNIGADCAFPTLDGQPGRLADYHVGQRIKITYEKIGGVRIARQIEADHQLITGVLTSVDQEQNAFWLKAKGLRLHKSLAFRLAPDGRVSLDGDKTGQLQDLAPGQRITVLYDEGKRGRIAHRIEQPHRSMTGVITAIDLADRAVKVKHRSGSDKFNLASDCQITAEDKQRVSLADLRLGETVTVAFQEVDGVKVTYSLARTAPAAAAAPAATATSNTAAAPAAEPPKPAEDNNAGAGVKQ